MSEYDNLDRYKNESLEIRLTRFTEATGELLINIRGYANILKLQIDPSIPVDDLDDKQRIELIDKIIQATENIDKLHSLLGEQNSE